MKVEKFKRGDVLVGIEITGCKYRTLRGAVKAMQKYIGEGWNFDEFSDFNGDAKHYVRRAGGDLSVMNYEGDDYATVVFDATSDCDGDIVYMWALVPCCSLTEMADSMPFALAVNC